MMDLKTQIITLLFSFGYGFLFSFFLHINYKFIYNNKIFIKVITSFLFILINILMYFIILKKINYGIIHIYYLIVIIIGFILELFVFKKINNIIAKKIKK